MKTFDTSSTEVLLWNNKGQFCTDSQNTGFFLNVFYRPLFAQ